MRPYRMRPSDVKVAGMLADSCNLGLSAAQVLIHRGICDVEQARSFLDARLRDLSSPQSMADRPVAAERIAAAIRRGERIVVFGDYDVDGTTSALILSEVIATLGGDVHTLVADRFRGGYGLSEEALTRCLDRHPGLLITCDCGSSDHERLAEAQARGIDTIVVDHHLVPEETLPALAFLNPHRADCGFEYKGLCSAGLAFSLGAELRAHMKAELDLRDWLDLVAIGTIADVAPLTGDNRRLVRAGLLALGSTRARPALVALRQAARIPDSATPTARDVAFRFAPRLNAPGRLGAADLTLRFLRSKTLREALALLREIEQHNESRKSLAREACEEAIAQAREVYGEAPTGGVVVAGEGWHRGVVGIVAARLVEQLGVPAVVIALEGDEGHGSARTVGDFDVHQALGQCASLLGSWGGHRAAAGVCVAKKALDELRIAFDRATRARAFRMPELEVDVALGGAYRAPTVEDLQRLGPFGEAHPEPLFSMDAHVVEIAAVGEDDRHGKLELQVGPDLVRAFAPGMFSRLRGRPDVRLIGEFHPDHFRGGRSVEFLVQEVVD